MKCSNVKKNLAAYVDDELSAETKAVILHHLETCSDCRQIAEETKSLADDLALLPKIDGHPYFMTRLKQLINDQALNSHPRLWIPRWIRNTIIPAGAVVMVLLTGIIGHRLGNLIYTWRTQKTQLTKAITETADFERLDTPSDGSLVQICEQLFAGGDHE